LTMQENAPDVVGDANVTLTGNALTTNLGTAVGFTDVDISITGQELTMQEGQVEVDDALATLTGIEMTMAEGSVKNVIWNPVDTGNAPIDPPGWKEVA